MAEPSRQDEVQFIRVQCPRLTCLRILAVPEDTRGRLIRCRACGMTVRVPARPAPEPAANGATG